MSSYECIILIWCVYLISHYKKIINTHRVPLVWRCWFLAKTEFLCSVSASQNSLFPKQRQRVRYTHYQNCDEICACKNLARSPTDIHYLNTPNQFVKIIWSSRTNYYQRYLAKTSARKVASRAPLMSQYNNIIIGINENARARALSPAVDYNLHVCIMRAKRELFRSFAQRDMAITEISVADSITCDYYYVIRRMRACAIICVWCIRRDQRRVGESSMFSRCL